MTRRTFTEQTFACGLLLDTYLSLRHDVEEVAVEGEGHVSQDRAPVLDDGYRLILDAAVWRPVDADLKKHRTQTGH